jgi:MFS family permease
MYSLGEVIGPSIGGVILERYGFPICSTVMAFATFFLAVIVLIFFSIYGQPVRPDKKPVFDTIEEENEESGDEGSPLLSERLAHYASMHNLNYGSVEGGNDNDNTVTSEVLKTVSVTASGAVEV